MTNEKRFRARMVTFEQWVNGDEESWYQEWLESPDMKTVFRSARYILRTNEKAEYKRRPDRTAIKATIWDITDEDNPVHLFDIQRSPSSSRLQVIIDNHIYDLNEEVEA